MFRKQALESRTAKWEGKAVLLPGMRPWLMTLLCLSFICAFLLFVINASYTRRVNVTGEVTTWPRAANVYSGVQGFVVKQFVTEGQLVKKGDPIYQIDISKSTRDGTVSENQRREIENQLTNVDNIIQRLKESKAATIAMLEKQKQQYIEASKRSADIIRRAEQGVKIMKNNMDNYQQYHAKGLVNKDMVIGHTVTYYQNQNNLLSLNGQNEQNALQVISLGSQIQSQSTEFDNRIYEMEMRRYELQKERLNVDAGGEIIIRAWSEGKINSLSVTPGQMVNAGDSLLQILPQHVEHYYLVLWVPNDTVPYLSVGDRVNVRYEAFPAQKFGQFTAKISLISKTPASPQEMMSYQGAPKDAQSTPIPYYKVLVKPEVQAISYHGKSITLENGMKAQSTLFLENRRIYQWMFSPFYDMKNSVMEPLNG